MLSTAPLSTRMPALSNHTPLLLACLNDKSVLDAINRIVAENGTIANATHISADSQGEAVIINDTAAKVVIKA